MNLETRSSEVLDVEGTLTRFGGDRQLFREIITFFLEDAPPLMQELGRAAKASNAQQIRTTAHSLKGLVAGCGGIRAAQAAQRVEHAADAAELKNIAALIDTLEREIDLLTQAAVVYRE
jgi:HPt (histidine-containing phosphotransfer) domain-containing protein